MGRLRTIVAGLCLVTATALLPAAPAAAVDPGTPGKVAFIRGGNLFVAEPSGTVWQATTDGGYEWPRWRPDSGDGLAILKDGNLHVGYFSSFSHTYYSVQQITFGGGTVGAAAWSPDGTKLAYAQGTTIYDPTIYIAYLGYGLAAGGATVTKVDTHLSPAAQALAKKLPKKNRTASAAAAQAAAPTAWNAARNSLAIAWSPNGQWIAYPNGECYAIFDNCLGVLDVNTGAEWWVAAFGGGGADQDGYATIPAFTADSATVMWTQQTRPRYEADPQMSFVHIMSGAVLTPYPQTKIGVDGESQAVPSPANDGKVLLTAGRSGVAWVARRNGATRTWLYQGYQPDWQAV